MSSALTIPAALLPQEYRAKAAALMGSVIPKEAKQDQIIQFMWHCHEAGLSPFRRQVHAAWVDGKLKAMMSIDGYRSVARAADPAYSVMLEYMHQADVWKAWPPLEGHSEMIHATVVRSNGVRIERYVSYREHVKMHYDKATGKWKPSKFWLQMPNHMLAKVAESLVLRIAFPTELSGIYSASELEGVNQKVVAGEVIEAEVEEVRPRHGAGNSHGGGNPALGTAKATAGFAKEPVLSKAQVTELVATAQQHLTPVGVETFWRQLVATYGVPPQVKQKHHASLVEKLTQIKQQEAWNSGRHSVTGVELMSEEDMAKWKAAGNEDACGEEDATEAEAVEIGNATEEF